MNNEPDYTQYSIEQLYDALNHIDAEKYPDRHKQLCLILKQKTKKSIRTTDINNLNPSPEEYTKMRIGVWKRLIIKRKSKLIGVPITGGFLLFFIGVMGAYANAHLMYWPLAVISFSLAIYPTLLAWLIMIGIYTAGSTMYIIFTLEELFNKGTHSGIYKNADVYYIYFTILLAIWLGLFFSKPTLKNNSGNT